ncbi:MAG: hypothetical protein C0478_13760 [Planctomyces sp.]|jgi:hypothetical protein|nr:hypothetical protein [Planctomyces sp.]
MTRFALLEHDWPKLHGDFLLEIPGLVDDFGGGLCWTWRLIAAGGHLCEELIEGQSVCAEVIPHHRAHYLEYSGLVTPAPDGSPRGSVTQLAGGEYRLVIPPRIGEPNLVPPLIEVDLLDAMLTGRMTLREGSGGWTAQLHRD